MSAVAWAVPLFQVSITNDPSEYRLLTRATACDSAALSFSFSVREDMRLISSSCLPSVGHRESIGCCGGAVRGRKSEKKTNKQKLAIKTEEEDWIREKGYQQSEFGNPQSRGRGEGNRVKKSYPPLLGIMPTERAAELHM